MRGTKVYWKYKWLAESIPYRIPSKRKNGPMQIAVSARADEGTYQYAPDKYAENILVSNVDYALTDDDIVITTEGKPIGIAGIMGGDDSKIEDTTSGIIIEAAIFHHVAIRNTARRLNLNTDASVRYQ